MKTGSVLRLAESGILLALATVLGFVRLLAFPYGGSVTAASMLPLMLIAYRHGTGWGMLCGAVFGTIQLLLGMNTLSYATSLWAGIAIVVIDYLAAFAAMGLAGCLRGAFRRQTPGLLLGGLAGCAVRYLCHVVSGCTVWAGLSVPTADAVVYSFIYNIGYMLPESVITLMAAAYVSSVLDFRGGQVTRSGKRAGVSPFRRAVIGGIPAVAVMAAAVLMFDAMGTENGFDVTAVVNAEWVLIAVILAAGAGLTAAVAWPCRGSDRARRVFFAGCALVLLAVEVYIGVYVHDGFVRPYLGDTLAVMWLYCVIRTVFPRGHDWLSAAIFAFAVLVEVSQIFPLCDVWHIENRLLRVLMGTSFSFRDIAAYFAGCALTAVFDRYFKYAGY